VLTARLEAPHRFLSAIRDGEPVERHGDGSAFRDWVFVEDAVDATLRVLDLGPRAHALYNVGSGKATTLAEFLAACEAVRGKAATVRAVGDRAGDVRGTVADISRLRADTGFAPRVGLAEGLRRTAAYLDAAGA